MQKLARLVVVMRHWQVDEENHNGLIARLEAIPSNKRPSCNSPRTLAMRIPGLDESILIHKAHCVCTNVCMLPNWSKTTKVEPPYFACN